MSTISRGRLRDFVELTKPGITRLVVLTAAAGFYLGSSGGLDLLRLLNALLGIGLAAGGTNALNEYWEREADGRMRRTRRRPLPSGRLRAEEALLFAVGVSAAGILYLWLTVGLATAGVVALSLITYVFVYTPLKKRTPVATVIGAIPGALPILAGWLAARGAVTTEAWILFGILFLWQLPHFLALGWIYRDDYRRGGFVLLSVGDEDGTRTARQALLWSLGLVVLSLAPPFLGSSGRLYLMAAIALGAGFLVCCARMALHRAPADARRLFRASIVYLPLLLLALTLDRALL